MSIRSKTVWLIGVSLSVFIGFSAAISYQFVSHRFEKLERDNVTTRLSTVHSEFQDRLDQLETIGVDWGIWDDTFEFIEDRNPDYINGNLNDSTLLNLDLDFMLFYDLNGNPVYRKFIAQPPDAPALEKTPVLTAIQEAPHLLSGEDFSVRSSGLLIAESSTYLIASHFITTSLPGNPSRGTIVIGRRLDASEIDEIGAATETLLTAFPIRSTLPTETLQSPAGVNFGIEPLNADTVLGRSHIVDLSGKQGLAITIEMDRSIYRQGRATWKQNTVSTLILGAGVVFLLLFILDRRILNRLSVLAQNVSNLSVTGENLDRLEVGNHDELGRLALSINSMLSELNRYHGVLRENEQFLRQLINAINCGVIVVDPENRTIFEINDTGLKLLQRDREDIVGKVCHKLICPNERDRCPVLDLNQEIDLSERIMLTPGGGSIPILKSVKAIEYRGKAYLVESFTDIRTLKKAEADLRESETRYRNFFEQDITGDVLTTIDGKIIDCNPAFAGMFGYESVEEIMSVDVNTFYASERKRILTRLKKEGRIERIQLEFIHRSNRPLYCIGNLVGHFDQQGNMTHISAYYFDDTKRVLLEKDLRKTHKMEAIGTLAGGIAHDFNNLLQPILGYTQLLKDDLPTESREREYAGRIISASLRAKDLVKQILAFSRRSSHKLTAVHFQKVMKDVANLCRSTIPANIEIHYDFQEDCPAVMADPTQLHQVAMNLIINAYHAVEESAGSIRVQLKETVIEKDNLKAASLEPGRYAMLSVSDDGCGMNEDTVEKIFEPYFTTKEQGKGTGLGLAVVYGIIREYHGDITVRSELGKGSTFKVYLPIADDFAEDKENQKPESYRGGTERVLLVDDEKMVLELVGDILKRLGYRVTSLQNSVAALDMFMAAPESFDLVITDMTMPEMTGDLLAEKILEIKPDIPIILCTGYSDETGSNKAKAIGIRDYLVKPVSIAEVSKTLRNVLGRAPSADVDVA